MNNSENSFLPDGYEAPQNGGGYMKLEDGENKFRILSKPIIGWIDWKDKKPLRFGFKFKPEKPVDPAKSIKHFWAFIVYNYKAKEVQILEITQATIHQALQGLSKDEEWGAPFFYDIKINRSGKDMETKYVVTPSPKKDLSPEQTKMALEKRINLNALFNNEDPYAVSENYTELAFESLPF